MKTQHLKTMAYSKSGSKREVYGSTILPQETRKKLWIDYLTLYLKQLEKGKQRNPKSSEGKKS